MRNDLDKYDQMVKLVKRYHVKQFNNNGKVPYWHHCIRVAFYLKQALLLTKELDNKSILYEDLMCATLGHDLYEDTEIQPNDIIKQFGDQVHRYIDYMTNYGGDFNRNEYVKKIANAPDEVRFIKLADLIDNTTTVAYGLHDLGTEWTYNFFLPIITEMKENINKKSFANYPKAANYLLNQFNRAFDLLQISLKNWEVR